MPEIIESQQPLTPATVIIPKRPDKIRLVLIIIFIILFIILAIFATLVFFKRTQAPKAIPKSAKIQIPCPTVPEFCQQAKYVERDGKILGIGGNLNPGTPIYAVFDGQTEIRTVGGPGVGNEEFIEVVVRNDQQKLRALYSVKYIEEGKGTMVSLPWSFKKGDTIATVSADLIAYYGNYNLVFKLINEQGEVIPLEDVSFK